MSLKKVTQITLCVSALGLALACDRRPTENAGQTASDDKSTIEKGAEHQQNTPLSQQPGALPSARPDSSDPANTPGQQPGTSDNYDQSTRSSE